MDHKSLINQKWGFMAFIKLKKTRKTEDLKALFAKRQFSRTKDNRWLCHIILSPELAKFLSSSTIIPTQVCISIDDQKPFLILLQEAEAGSDSWSLIYKNSVYRLSFTWKRETPTTDMQTTCKVKFDSPARGGIMIGLNETIS